MMQALFLGVSSLSVTFVFSMLGAGGSQVLVPVFFWLGLDFKSGAIPLALLSSAVALFSAGGLYLRRGLVRVGAAVPFALAVLAGSPLGAACARTASSTALMIVFALVNMAVGLLVLRGRSLVGEGITRRAEVAVCVATGAVIGFMIGFVARDGGPFTMAVLVLMGCEAREAAGTAPVIVAAGCLAAFIVHAFAMEVDWILVPVVIAAGLAGSQAGARFMSARMESKGIRYLFAAVMVGVGAVILVQALF